jgi:multicomponent K+:H+ antiporter subunit A
VGTLPIYTVAPLLATAVMGSLQTELPTYSLAIWHGFNTPLVMSFIAFFGGVWIYIKREWFYAWYENNLSHIDARIPYYFIVDKLYDFASFVTRKFDNGSLQNMITWFVIASLVAGICGFGYSDAAIFGQREFLEIDLISIIATFILIIATLYTTLFHHNRFVAVIAIGVVGLIVSMIFIKFSAPDLALTQLSVETVTIILLMLALYYLPQKTPKESSHPRIIKDVILSLMAGLGVFILTLAVLSREYTTIGTYFLENALTGGGGTNVVNVILVDFRGFDTLGEITVLAIAGLGIFAMLQELKLFAPKTDAHGNAWSKDMHPPIMQTLTRLILPLMLMVAIYIFIRGHNLPGGGFIAGLIAAVALIVQYLSNGIDWTKKRLRFDKHTLIYLGLLIATLTGVVSMFIGYPFLTSAFTHVHWPIVGEFEVASAIAFDLGVFLVVVGSTVMILVQLGKLSLNSHTQTEHDLHQDTTQNSEDLK